MSLLRLNCEYQHTGDLIELFDHHQTEMNFEKYTSRTFPFQRGCFSGLLKRSWWGNLEGYIYQKQEQINLTNLELSFSIFYPQIYSHMTLVLLCIQLDIIDFRFTMFLIFLFYVRPGLLVSALSIVCSPANIRLGLRWIRLRSFDLVNTPFTYYHWAWFLYVFWSMLLFNPSHMR